VLNSLKIGIEKGRVSVFGSNSDVRVISERMNDTESEWANYSISFSTPSQHVFDSSLHGYLNGNLSFQRKTFKYTPPKLSFAPGHLS